MEYTQGSDTGFVTSPSMAQEQSFVPADDDVPVHPHKNSLFIFLPIWLLLIGISTYFFMNGRKRPPIAPTVEVVKNIPNTPSETAFFLSITSPRGSISAVDGELLIMGRTLPNTPVIMYTETDEYSVDSDAQGQFEGSVHVEDEGGLVQVVAYSPSGEEKSETLAVALTDSEMTVLGESDEAPGRVKKNTNVGKSVVEFTSPNELKMHTAVDAKTPEVREFLQKRNATRRQEKIGAMKLKEIIYEDSSGSASRGLGKLAKMESKAASPGASLSRHAVMGVVTAVSNGVITISHQTQTDRVWSVLYNADTIVSMKGSVSPKPSDIVVGMRIAAVGTPTDEGLLAKRIHIIPGKNSGVSGGVPTPTVLVVPSAMPSAIVTPHVSATPSVLPTEAQVSPTPSPIL